MKFLSEKNSQEVKKILTSAKFKVGTVATTLAYAVQTTAFAVDPVAPDISSVTASMTTTFGTVTSICLSALAAIAPVGISIFGACFAWKKGIGFFKHLTQA